MFEYRAKVLRVVDGDTVEVEIDLGFHVFVRDTVRLYGVNTPETHGPKAKTEKTAGLEATAFVQSWVTKNPLVILSLFSFKRSSCTSLIGRNGLRFAVPFTSKRQQRAAFGGHIPGISKAKAKEWAAETDFSKLPDRAPAEKGKPTLLSKESQLAHAHENAKGIAPSQLRASEEVELEHGHEHRRSQKIDGEKVAGLFDLREAQVEALTKGLAAAPELSKKLFLHARKALPDVVFDAVDSARGKAYFSPRFRTVAAPLDQPHALAHELGHAKFHESRVGRLLQNWPHANALSHAADAAAPILGATAGMYSGYTADDGGSQAAPALLAGGALTAAHAPLLLPEAAASLHGRQMLKQLGASPAELATSDRALLRAFGTYAKHPLTSIALAAGGYGVGQLTGRRAKAQARERQVFATPPTKEAGFKLDGEQKFRGLDIAIENAKGSTRKWHDPHGKETGSTFMHHAYGYIRLTKGTDGDHVDVYIGPDEDAENVFIIDQMKKPDFKTFDEQKVMLGFKNAAEAKAAYLKQYNDPRFFGSMKEMGLDEFRKKVLDKKNHGEKVANTIGHTKTLPDGRKVDVVKLWGLTKDIPAHEVELSSSKATSGVSRSSSTGFGPKRLQEADLSHPILVHRSLLLDGRHRVAKATDSGVKALPAKEVPAHIIEHAVVTKNKTAAPSGLHVYSYVAKSSLPDVLEHGLHSGKSLLQHPHLLESAAKARGIPAEQMEKDIRKNLSTWKGYSSLGPNIMFTMMDPNAKLLENHPSKMRELVPVKIDLGAVLRDHPETKLYGMELVPYDEYVRNEKSEPRHRYLKHHEVVALANKSPSELWSTYNDIERSGKYAPDVPHAAVHTSSGHIDPKYLTVVEPAKPDHASKRFAERSKLSPEHLSSLKGRILQLRSDARLPNKILQEHNMVTTLPREYEPVGDLMRSLRKDREARLLSSVGVQYGQGPRLSRHARRHVTNMLEAEAAKQAAHPIEQAVMSEKTATILVKEEMEALGRRALKAASGKPPVIGGKEHTGDWALVGSGRLGITRPDSDVDYMVPLEQVKDHLHEFKPYKGVPGVYWKDHPEVDGRTATVVAVPRSAYHKIDSSYQSAVDRHTPEELRKIREEKGKDGFYKHIGITYTSDAMKDNADKGAHGAKIAATRQVKLMREMARKGNWKELSDFSSKLLEKGVLKVSPQGTNVRRLGAGAEAIADAVVGAGNPALAKEAPVAVRKVFDRFGPMFSKEQLAEKANYLRRIRQRNAPAGLEAGALDFAKLYGGIRSTPGGAKFMLQEHIPEFTTGARLRNPEVISEALRDAGRTRAHLKRLGLPEVDPIAVRKKKQEPIIEEFLRRGLSPTDARRRAEEMIPSVGNPHLKDLHGDNMVILPSRHVKVLDFSAIPAHRVADAEKAHNAFGARLFMTPEERRRQVAKLWAAEGIPVPPSALGRGGRGVSTGPKSGKQERAILGELGGFKAPEPEPPPAPRPNVAKAPKKELGLGFVPKLMLGGLGTAGLAATGYAAKKYVDRRQEEAAPLEKSANAAVNQNLLRAIDRAGVEVVDMPSILPHAAAFYAPNFLKYPLKKIMEAAKQDPAGMSDKVREILKVRPGAIHAPGGGDIFGDPTVLAHEFGHAIAEQKYPGVAKAEAVGKLLFGNRVAAPVVGFAAGAATGDESSTPREVATPLATMLGAGAPLAIGEGQAWYHGAGHLRDAGGDIAAYHRRNARNLVRQAAPVAVSAGIGYGAGRLSRKVVDSVRRRAEPSEKTAEENNMPFTSKRQQRAAFAGAIPGISKEKAREWAHETPNLYDQQFEPKTADLAVDVAQMKADRAHEARADRITHGLDALGLGILAAPAAGELAEAVGKKLETRGGRLGALGGALHRGGHAVHQALGEGTGKAVGEVVGLGLMVPHFIHPIAHRLTAAPAPAIKQAAMGVNDFLAALHQRQEDSERRPKSVVDYASELHTPAKVAVDVGRMLATPKTAVDLTAVGRYAWKNRRPLAGAAALGTVGAGLLGAKKVIDHVAESGNPHHAATFAGVPAGMRPANPAYMPLERY